MTRSSTIAVGAGAFGAALLVAFFKGSVLGVMFGAMLSPLPLAMAALGLGVVYLPVAVVGGAVTVMVLTGSFVLPVIYLVVDAAPVAMLARMVRSNASEGRAPEGSGSEDKANGAALGRTLALMMVGASVLIVAGLVTMPADGGIEATLPAQIDQVIGQPIGSGAIGPGAIGPGAIGPGAIGSTLATEMKGADGGIDFTAARAQVVKSLAGLLPGAAAWNWSLRALISAALGQLMLKRMGLALETTPAYRQMSLPGWFFLLLGGVAGAALILKGDPGFIAGNTAAALSLPAVLQGLAVVHCAVGRLKHPRLALVVFYMAAVLAPTIILAALVVGGVVDHFFQLRGRYLLAADRR